jgi:hypothetical protein
VPADPAGPGSGADRDGGDCGDRDEGTETHHEGRGRAHPEQALGEREDQHQDGARARPQPDRHDGGQPAPPAAGSGEFFRFGRVGVPPCGGIIVIVNMVVRILVVMIAVRSVGWLGGVGVTVMVVIAMCMLVLVLVLVTVTVIMRVIMMIMRRFGWRHRGPERGGRTAELAQRRDEGAPLHPQQTQAHDDDERIA